jgi:hypothetical protein
VDQARDRIAAPPRPTCSTTAGRLRRHDAGAKLTAGAAAATAQLIDADGTVLVDLAAPANGATMARHSDAVQAEGAPASDQRRRRRRQRVGT